MSKCKWIVASMAALMFAVTVNAKDLETLAEGVKVDPLRVAKVKMNADGTVTMIGGWVDYKGGNPGQSDHGFVGSDLWDAFEHNDAGAPTEAGPIDCTIGSSRWYFGTTYCNMFAVADMAPEGGDNTAKYFNPGWYSGPCGGPDERQMIAIFGGDSFDRTCDGYTLGSGVIADFGALPCNPGHYWYSNIDLQSTNLGIPIFDGQDADYASYGYVIAQDFDGQTLTLSTCAQPMLWGADPADDRHAAMKNHWTQRDDDNPIDGQHSDDECYDYRFGVCPDPLTAMVSFGVAADGGGDCSGEETLRRLRAKTACDRNDFVRVVKVIFRTQGGVPGDTVTVEAAGKTKDKVVNDVGKATVRLRFRRCQDLQPGDTFVGTATWGCGASDEQTATVNENCPNSCPP